MDKDILQNILPSELRAEVLSSEVLKVEFKEAYSGKQDIRHTMIAFANAIGGRIFIGVREISNADGVHIGEVQGVSSLIVLIILFREE